MIYLDNGATSFPKPPEVIGAVTRALEQGANPGRGGYGAAMEAARVVFDCREAAGKLFHCKPEQVVLTSNCTHGLNIAIGSLVKPGARVLISGFEHNAVTRPLYARQADIRIAGKQLFAWEELLDDFRRELKKGVDAAVFTHVSNVFGYILPVEQMAALCRERGVPFVIDAAQSAGALPVSLKELGADFIAMPGHKGLLGPQGTGLLLCAKLPRPLLYGGTGSESAAQDMPGYTPERAEAGTLNVPGIAGLAAGIQYLKQEGIEAIGARERKQTEFCTRMLNKMGITVFTGPHQAGTLSFLPEMDCEIAAQILARQNVAVRAGLHCAPLAHESAGTLSTGTVRISFGHDAGQTQSREFLKAAAKLMPANL